MKIELMELRCIPIESGTIHTVLGRIYSRRCSETRGHTIVHFLSPWSSYIIAQKYSGVFYTWADATSEELWREERGNDVVENIDDGYIMAALAVATQYNVAPFKKLQ